MQIKALHDKKRCQMFKLALEKYEEHETLLVHTG